MRKNTKNTLMIAAAAAALTVGSTLAFAQGAPGGSSNPASKSAPAEKMAPSSGPTSGGGQHAQMPGGQRGEERGAAQNHMQGQMNERNERAQDRDNRTRSETTGQAPNQAAPQANPKEKSKGNAEQQRFENNAQQRGERNERNRSTTGQGASENRGGAMQNRESREQGGASTSVEGRDKGASSVNLTTEQRTKIHSVIIADHSAPRVEHVDFDVRVGTVVPRGKVHFAPVPSSIVEIEPVWRGFEYFLVGDQIVIVDPADLHIVAVIAA